MKKTLGFAVLAAMVATLVSTSLFADNRHRQTTYDDRYGRSSSRHVSVEGRIREIQRERNGFVIRLDRRDVVLFAPVQTDVYAASSRQKTRVRDLRRGDSIRAFGSYDRRGTLQVDRIEMVRDTRRLETLVGTVEGIDDRRSIVWMRDSLRRSVAVDARRLRNDRYSDLRNLHRGDRIAVTGVWLRAGEFEAHQIELARRW